MAKPPRDVTDAELAVLRILWERGRATIRELCNELYPEGTAAQYATVQKLLERLEAKQFVARDRSTVPHEFEASVAHDEFVGMRLDQLADELCSGSFEPLLSHLVSGRKLDKNERDKLRALVDSLEREKRRSR